MRVLRTISCLVVLAIAVAAERAWTAEETNAPVKKSEREQLREQLKNLTPEERAARLKELREKSAPPGDEVDRRREMLRRLSPEEREAKLKELRDRAGAERQSQEKKKLTLEEREAKRKEVRQRLEQQLETLRKKAADDTISAEERVRLQRLEKIYLRFAERMPLPGGSTPDPVKTAKDRELAPNPVP